MRLIIELESCKSGLLTLMPENTALPCLDMAPAGPAKPSRIPVTSAQFRALARDIEGHAEGKFGVARDLQLWVCDLDSGERERTTFAQAAQVIELNMLEDSAAAELQAKQAAEVEAAHAAKLAAKQEAAKDDPNGLAAGVNAAVEALTETTV